MKPTPEPYRLYVMGKRDLRSPDGGRVSSLLAQPKRLCLLTFLALAPDPVARSTVMALFWPESDEARARNALDQAIFYLRRSLSSSVVENVDGGGVHYPFGYVKMTPALLRLIRKPAGRVGNRSPPGSSSPTPCSAGVIFTYPNG